MAGARVVTLFVILCTIVLASAATFPTSADLGVLKEFNKTLKERSWISSNPCGKWKYLYCEGGRVASIVFDGAPPFNAPLPSKFGDLSALQNFRAVGLKIIGPIPESIQKLVVLLNLVLTNNLMTGNIPAGLSKLKKLTVLYLNNNLFSGELPSSLYLPKLSVLDLSFNSFYGKFPPRFLSYDFNIKNNQFSGPIPNKFPSTGAVAMQNNYFTGPTKVTYGGLAICSASLQANCLTYTKSTPCLSYIEKQRTASECKKFCGADSAKGPCNGNGACYLAGAKKVPTCKCNAGFKSAVVATIPTCTK